MMCQPIYVGYDIIRKYNLSMVNVDDVFTGNLSRLNGVGVSV